MAGLFAQQEDAFSVDPDPENRHPGSASLFIADHSPTGVDQSVGCPKAQLQWAADQALGCPSALREARHT